ncbi:MAG: hypothetical protein ACRCSG_01765 [Cellulosilyticaceae bacterium]
MKKVLYNDITATAKQPFIKQTHQHYNEMIEEMGKAFGESLALDNTKVNILYGCVNTGTGLLPTNSVNISAGAVYYNGEIYQVDAFTIGSLTNAVTGTITTTYSSGDPLLFSDNNTHNVHQIRKIMLSDAPSVGALNFANWLPLNISNQYKNVTGAIFKYKNAIGNIITIVAPPTINNFRYVIKGNTCHLQIDISGIDTTTSNSGAGFEEIIIENLPMAIKSKSNFACNFFAVKYDTSGALFSENLLGNISNNIIKFTANGTLTGGDSTNTKIFGEITYEI